MIITLTLPADGTNADVTDYNGPIQQIVNVLNGGIDSTNLADGAVITTKILDGAVTTSKLAANAVTAAKMETQQTWQTPTYQNSWIDYDAGTTYGGLQYYKDSLGIVHLRGLIKSGTVTAGTAITTLPVGYRPGRQLIFEVTSNDVRGRIDVTPTGIIQTGAGISNLWVSLANITFRAEG